MVFQLKTTAQKIKFSVKDFFSKCDPIRRKLRILPHLLLKFSMENFIFFQLIKHHKYSQNRIYEVRNSRVTKSSCETELPKMTPHFESPTRKFYRNSSFELLTQTFNFYYSTLELLTWSWKIKKFHFELLTRRLNFYFFTSELLTRSWK